MPGARLVALCDRDDVKAAAVAQKFGIPKIYSDADEMLRSETLDFVDVAAGPEAHTPLVLLAASRHMPVICQKPMAMDYPTCERMVRACREAGTTFLVHENFRWQTPMRRVKQLLEAGCIGRPFRAHLQFSHGDLSFFDKQPYLYAQPHFALYDMGPHLLDLARFFFGEPGWLFAQEFQMHPRFAGEDIVSVVLGSDRLTCHCELSWRTTGYEVFIEGPEGTITWNPDGRLLVATDAGETSERLTAEPYPWADLRYGFAHSSIVATNRNLLATLRGECNAETTGEDNLKTMWLLHLALESARCHQALPVSETCFP
ncbi:MAG: Gfo/Idh/MocA family oxidoreductase [Verrucomicrobiales bacterium]|nr:Gfo/Idh/MocA family oxidoreductase [Verrucomicrobiales bacterium]